MDEATLRLEYWEDNRSDRDFPLWVIFKFIGQGAECSDGLPYLRHSRKDLPTILKRLEGHPSIDALAQDLGVYPDELRATLWYCTWVMEHRPPPPTWEHWNHRLDKAWENNTLTIDQRKGDEPHGR